MGKPLKNPPVYFTVAQARFNPVLNLKEYLPAIQESMRLAGYPVFQAANVFVVTFVTDGQPTPTPAQHEKYIIGTADERHNFVLTHNALTLQSTDYGNFEAFSDKFAKGLQLVHDAVKLDFVDRIGLRYLDHVAPLKQDDVMSYLAPEVLGLGNKLPGIPQYTFSESLNVHEQIQLRSRVVIQNGPVSFPPDLFPEGLKVNGRFMQYVGPHAILDNDGFIEGRAPVDVGAISAQLSTIHDAISAAFKAVTTDYARKAWDE
jgi:uncharacterized protein (TIGR04255 family)